MVATPKGTKRDGRFLEILGTYDPQSNPARITLKEEKVRKWISCGAQPTEVVRSIIRKVIPNYLEGLDQGRKQKVLARRRARKSRIKAQAKK